MQHRVLKARQENQIPDTVLILQHTPVVTLGNRGRDNYLLKSPEEYATLGIDLFRAERGGDVTYLASQPWPFPGASRRTRRLALDPSIGVST